MPLSITTFETGSFPEAQTLGTFQQGSSRDRGPVPISQWTFGVASVDPFAVFTGGSFVQVSAWAHMFSRSTIATPINSSFVNPIGILVQNPTDPTGLTTVPQLAAWDGTEITASYLYNGAGPTSLTSPLSFNPDSINAQWLIANQWSNDNITASPNMPITYTTVGSFDPGIWDLVIHVAMDYLTINNGQGAGLGLVTGPFPPPQFFLTADDNSGQFFKILDLGTHTQNSPPGIPPFGIQGSIIFQGTAVGSGGNNTHWEYQIRLDTNGPIPGGRKWRPKFTFYYNSQNYAQEPVVVNWQANRVS